MGFEWFFCKKTASLQSTQKQIPSSITVLISQISVSLGIIIIYLTFSIGIGTRYAIKKKLAAFSGHVLVIGIDDNKSYDSSPISTRESFCLSPSWKVPVANISEFAFKSGIIRTKKYSEGILLKGVSSNYQWSRFKDFIIKGRPPYLMGASLNYEVLISKNIAAKLGLDVKDCFIIYFSRKSSLTPIVRRFSISGIYSTGIKNFDETIIIGDLKQIRRINQWEEDQTGGFEIFTENIDNIEALENEVKTNIRQGLKARGVLSRFKNIRNWMGIFDKNIIIVTLIMSFVVIINITGLLFILVLDRTYTISILKTLGTTNISIRRIFIFYAFRILFFALLWGNLIALGILFSQKYFGWVHLNSEIYYLNVLPTYIHPILIIGINISASFLSLFTLWVTSTLIDKISPIKYIKHC